jgi:hypothetical protein
MPHLSNKHWDTPYKAALQTQAKLVDTEILYDANSKAITRRRLFTLQRIPSITGYRIVNNTNPRRLAHSETCSETRDRKIQFTKKNTRVVERVLWKCGWNGRVLFWDAFTLETEIDVSNRTV